MDASEYKSSSNTIIFTPLSAPDPPRLRVTSVDLQLARIEWTPAHYAKGDLISGYRLLINSVESQLFDKKDREFVFKDLQPGKSYKLEIVALTNATIGKSLPSNAITIVCPNRPNPPLITQMSTVRPYSVVVGWKAAAESKSTKNKFDLIQSYR
jgi:hypothetical protein